MVKKFQKQDMPLQNITWPKHNAMHITEKRVLKINHSNLKKALLQKIRNNLRKTSK